MFKFFESINKNFLLLLISLFFFFPAGTIFLFFTLNAFCSFYMLSLKTFTIFQLIEKANWIFLSAFGIFSLCFSTETTNKAITDCTTLLNTIYSHDACENINHQVEVCWKPSNRLVLNKIAMCNESFFFTDSFFPIFLVVHSNRLK